MMKANYMLTLKYEGVKFIGGQLRHCLLHADALRPSGDVSDPLLEPSQSLRRNDPPNLWAPGEAKAEKFVLCGRATAPSPH